MRGWGKGAIPQEQQREYVQMYENWKRQSRLLNQKQVLPKEPPHALSPTQLDGKYWRHYQFV